MFKRGKKPAGAPAKDARKDLDLAWDVAPLMLLAGAGVALLQDPEKAKADVRRTERGRGRGASSPREIPKAGWKDILLRTKQEFSEDQVTMVAAGVTFYTLLALFPGLGAFVALYGLFADPAQAQKHLTLLSFMLPADAIRFLSEQMTRIASAKEGGLSLAFVAGLLTSVWSANGAMKALITGLNIAYEEQERRSFVRKTATSLVFTFGFILFVLIGVGLLAAGPVIETFVGHQAAVVFGWVSWPLLLVGLAVGLALLYRYGPSRDPVRWQWISWGSAGVILFWVVASAAFSLYVANFAHYDDTYGPLGAVIGFMMWTWLSTVVVLAGAELNAEIEHQTARDTTVGPERPLGQRRARMADTVGAAQHKNKGPQNKKAGAESPRRPNFRLPTQRAVR
ncbi:YihY/virulence factor BrkB family protein [Phenylobacterium deserti]|uniref:YihY/virulence factor BrkB family protein n=1 Tax=Phenylobacterium deserti TaxID=1914756 RepID=A0A328ABM6_9CAUL|nr:YihY/virulence factor BrkB family protein [Phenylobacterium deserti]RAK51989.1 YihY/virulence factor BrkB family protein [Phenylobacterium deserti]